MRTKDLAIRAHRETPANHLLVVISVVVGGLVLGVLSLSQPSMALGLPLLVIFSFMLLRDVKILYFVLLVSLFLSSFMVADRELSELLTMFLLPVFFAAVALNQQRLTGGRMGWVIFLLITQMLASVIYALLPEETYEPIRYLLTSMVLYFLTVNMVRKQDTFGRTIDVLVYSVGFFCLVIFMGQLTGIYDVTVVGLPEATGLSRMRIFGDRNECAQVAVAMLPLSLFGIFTARGKKKFFYLAAAFSMILSVLSTNSRGGLLGLALVAVIFVIKKRKNRSVLRAFLAVSLMAFLVIPHFYAKRIKEIKAEESSTVLKDASTELRVLILKNGFEMFKENIILGVGYGNFRPIIASYDPYGRLTKNWAAHNMYLHLGAELGILGFFLFFVLLIFFFQELNDVRKSMAGQVQTEWFSYQEGLRLGMTGFLVTAVFLSSIGSGYLWVLLGLATCLRSCCSDQMALGKKRLGTFPHRSGFRHDSNSQ